MTGLPGMKRFLLWSLLPCILIWALVISAFILGCGGDGSSQISYLVNRAAEAGENIDSYHMSMSMLLEDGQSASIKTDELSFDIDGENVRLKEIYYDPQTGQGTLIQEMVRVDGRQYAKDPQSGQWVEEEPSAIEETAATYTSHLKDFLSHSTSGEEVGQEQANGVSADHLRFQLSPQNISDLLPSTPEASLEENAGGQVDVWIDSDRYFPVKYEMVFRHILMGKSIGFADVRMVIDITRINEPIEIKTPVQ